jgi:hypothetical protein
MTRNIKFQSKNPVVEERKLINGSATSQPEKGTQKTDNQL